MQPAIPTKARHYRQKHRSGNVTWKVLIGKQQNGRDCFRNFQKESEAEAFTGEWNATLAKTNSDGLSDLAKRSRTEVNLALERLEPFGASILEAVDFFLAHARPPKGKITVAEAISEFLRAKERAKCSQAYLKGTKHTYLLPFQRHFKPARIVSEITHQEAKGYILKRGKNWNAKTTTSHITYLTTFYNFLKKDGSAKLNPFETLERPRHRNQKIKALTPKQAKLMLEFALKSGQKGDCAVMALVLFCGVRLEEAARLDWSNLDLREKDPIVKVEIQDSKIGSRRVLYAPENAAIWLRLCAGEGKIAQSGLAQRLKRLRSRVKSTFPEFGNYPQNAMRHSFAAYHYNLPRSKKSEQTTALMMGHSRPSLLNSTYLESVAPEDIAPYWNILPDSVLAERKLADERQMEEERQEADFQSDEGQKAFLGDDGHWHPSINPSKPRPTEYSPEELPLGFSES